MARTPQECDASSDPSDLAAATRWSADRNTRHQPGCPWGTLHVAPVCGVARSSVSSCQWAGRWL